jgi:hypothetical protein
MSLEKVQIPIYRDPLTENPVYFDVKQEYLNYIDVFRQHKTANDQFIGGMPVQIQSDCLSQLLRTTPDNKLVYNATLKVNGVRHLMFLSKSGIIYFIDRITNIFYFTRLNGEIVSLQPTEQYFLFDGELVNYENQWEFLIFDVIFYPDNGVVYNWMSHNYNDRLAIIKNALKDIPKIDVKISMKKWFPITEILKTPDFYNYVIKRTNNMRKQNNLPILQDDGLILQPFDGAYIPFTEWNAYNNVQFKWKPPRELTVDFKIKITKKNEWSLLTKTNENYGVKQPDGSKINAIMLPNRNYKENDVVECKLFEGTNPYKNIFVPILKRTDKTEGNSYQTITSTLDAMTNKFTLDILKPAIESIQSGKDMQNVLEFYSLNKLVICSVANIFTTTEINQIKNIYQFYVEKRNYVMERKQESESDESETGSDYEYFEFGASKPFRLNELLQQFKKRETRPQTYYELEFKIYPYIKKGKKENIQKFTYYYFLDFLKKSGMRHVYTPSIDILMSTKSGTVRSTYQNLSLIEPVENLIKQQIAEYRALPCIDSKLTFKLSLSSETTTKTVVKPKNKSDNLLRVKFRDSFYFTLWRIDITRVLTTIGNTEPVETYEIECEYIGGVVDFTTFINSMSEVYKIVLFNTNYC